MATVGFVVNPGASRDVRRGTSLARTIEANAQVNTDARVRCGLATSLVRRAAIEGRPVGRTR